MAALACVSVLPGCGAGGQSTAHSTSVTAASRPSALKAPPLALRLSLIGRLPAAVQDPATAAVGGHPVLMGGLDQADVSVAAVSSAGADGARRLGSLPLALHDAAGATLSGSAYVIGGGEPSHSEIIGVDPFGSASVRGALPVGQRARDATRSAPCHPLTHAAAVALSGRVYVIGGRGDLEGTQTARILALDPGSGRVTHDEGAAPAQVHALRARRGRSPAAAVPTWVACPHQVTCCGSRVATTRSCTRSTPRAGS